MWNDCKLDGDELAAKASALLVNMPYAFGGMASARICFATLVETQQVYLDPPHSIELNMGPGKPREYQTITEWRATVSARVRTYPNACLPHIGKVGRGSGPDPVTATLRAIVASFGSAA